MKTLLRPLALACAAAALVWGLGASRADAHTGTIAVSCQAITATLQYFPARGADITISASVNGNAFTSTVHLPSSGGVVAAGIGELTAHQEVVNVTNIAASWTVHGGGRITHEDVQLDCGPVVHPFAARTHASALCQSDGRYRIEVVIENKGEVPFSVTGDSLPVHLSDVPTLQPGDRVVAYVYVAGSYSSTSYTLSLSADDESTHEVTGSYPRNVPTGTCTAVTTTTGATTTTMGSTSTTGASSTTSGHHDTTSTTRAATGPTLASTGPKPVGGLDSNQLIFLGVTGLGVGGAFAGINRRRRIVNT